MTRAWKFAWGLCLIALLASGSALLALGLQTYPVARAWMDRLSKDGSLDIFTPSLFAALQLPLLLLGVLLLVAAVAMLLFRARAIALLQSAWAWPGRIARQFAADSRVLWQAVRAALRLTRNELFLLAALILAAALLRGLALNRPMQHDEAYTVVTFASSNLRELLTDYHHPNNHIFHSLLVFLSFKLFGFAPWAVRLPVFVTSLLVIPLAYLLARRLYDRWTALLAAGLVAALPALLNYATNARGYPLLMLCTLLDLCLVVYLMRHDNRAAWGLFILCSALAFWSIPVFIYPFGMILAWLCLSTLMSGRLPAYGSWWGLLRRLLVVGAILVVLVFLLYVPVLFGSGPEVLRHNLVNKPLDWQNFVDELRNRGQDTWIEWNEGLPAAVSGLLVAGVLLSFGIEFLWNRCFRDDGIWRPVFPLQLAALLWIAAILLIQRASPWARFWAFAIPLAAIWAVSGYVGLLRLFAGRFSPRPVLVRSTAGLVLIAAFGVLGWWLVHTPEALPGYLGAPEKVVLFLKGQLVERDLVVVSPPHDAKVWYYARLHALDMNHFKRELPFFRTYVLVDTQLAQTTALVMTERGPDLVFFGEDLSQAREVYRDGSLFLYELLPDLRMIRNEYHLEP